MRAEVRTPAALTSVAGTAVLGVRLAMLGWAWAGIAALAIAAVVWALLLTPVLAHWRTPTDGSSLVLIVATESLAALAISTLAAGKLLAGANSLAILGDGGGTVKDVALGLWVLTMLWLPVLVAAELLRPRLRYDVRRWSTVFPFGMYAACSFVVGTATHVTGVSDFARVWVWVAVAVWAVVLGAMIGRGARAIR